MSRRDITPEDLALHAMNLLPDAERLAVEQLLESSPEGQQEIALIRGDLAIFAMGTEIHTPPTLARQRLLKQVVRERKPASSAGFEAAPLSDISSEEPQFLRSFQSALKEADTGEEKPERNLFWRTLPWLGWVAAAALGVFAFTLSRENENVQSRLRSQTTALNVANESADRAQLVLDTITSASAQRFILTKMDIKAPASGRVSYMPDRGSLVFQANNLDVLPAAKTYELWLIPVGEDRKPTPAGTFKPDANGYAQVILPNMPKGVAASKFGVTIEDDGGADVPTMPIVLIGQ